MKQNTKFLWMYVGILFSFALILVVFAGFSRNTVTEQKEGLQSDVTKLSKQNTELKSENDLLKKQLDELISLKDLQTQSDANFENAETILAQAYADFKEGKISDARGSISSLDKLSLTDTQKIVYDYIMG